MKTGEMSYGVSSNLRDELPNGSFIGFTGTLIKKTDANTRAVFKEDISIYDTQRDVADKATVSIYYESRISKLSLNAKSPGEPLVREIAGADFMGDSSRIFCEMPGRNLGLSNSSSHPDSSNIG